MLGMCPPRGKYAYLRDVSDDVEVLHPDIVADFGYGLTASGSYDHVAGKTALLSCLVHFIRAVRRGARRILLPHEIDSIAVVVDDELHDQ